MDIVISEFMDEEAISEKLSDHKVLYDPTLVDRRSDLLKALTTARALVVRNRTQVDEKLLTAATNLMVVGRLGVGLDNIDMEMCESRKVHVFPATGANNIAVAEYVITSMLMLVRGTYHATEQVIAGDWPRNQLMGGEVYGRVLGLVGFGAIAREVAFRAQALGLVVAAYDPYLPSESDLWKGVCQCSFDELIAKSDILSLHTPLTEETRHSLNTTSFEAMKETAYVINAARGGIIDQTALIEAIESKKIAGAALDVFEEEPLSAVGAKDFRGVDNVILTPHIAGITAESNARVSRMTLDNILKILEGNPATG